MVGASEKGEEAGKSRVKAIMIFLGRELWNRRLLPHDECKFRDQIDHELAIRTYRLEQEAPPPGYFLLILAEEFAHERLERLGQSCVRDIALVLIELATGQKAARQHQNLVQFVDNRGFADTGVAGDEHDFRHPTTSNDPIKGGE